MYTPCPCQQNCINLHHNLPLRRITLLGLRTPCCWTKLTEPCANLEATLGALGQTGGIRGALSAVALARAHNVRALLRASDARVEIGRQA